MQPVHGERGPVASSRLREQSIAPCRLEVVHRALPHVRVSTNLNRSGEADMPDQRVASLAVQIVSPRQREYVTMHKLSYEAIGAERAVPWCHRPARGVDFGKSSDRR